MQAGQKPKIAKGARDFLPDQMAIREDVFNRITAVFKRHGEKCTHSLPPVRCKAGTA